MRTKSSFRKQQRKTMSESTGLLTDEHNTSSILQDAGDTTSMLAMQELVEKARSCTIEVQKGIIRAGLSRHLYSFEPRPMQVDAIWHLVFKKADLLLAAKTSFGKSVIFQATPLFCRGGIAIIIIPLDRIGKEQCIKIRRLPGATPVFVNGKTDKTAQLAYEIETGVYTHIIMGPEIAAGWFQSISRDPSFKKRVSVVAIDELHLVALWGNGIRPQYAQLSLFRRRLGGSIPWFGCSATLDQKTLSIARKMTGFHSECEFFRSSVDRPEILLIVETIQPRTTRSFTSLFFVLTNAMTDGLPTLERIPKTVIFIDSRRDIQRCADSLRDWLKRLSGGAITDSQARQLIQVYHSHTAENDKNSIYAEFSKMDSKIRIMVATESLGTGVDLSDVVRVVQYGFPLDRLLSVLIQRFGRAARLPGMKGEAIFMVESWAVGDRAVPTRRAIVSSSQIVSPSLLPSSTSRLSQMQAVEAERDISDNESDVAVNETEPADPTDDRRKRKSDRERRTDLYNDSPALFDYVNRSSCLRRILMSWLEESMADPATQLPPPHADKCCNVCNKALTRSVTFPWNITRDSRRPQVGTASGAFYDRLVVWCDKTVCSIYPMLKPETSVQVVAEKSELVSISTEYALIHTKGELEAFLKSTWMKDRIDELFEEFEDIKSYVVRNWPVRAPRDPSTVNRFSMQDYERQHGERQSTANTEHRVSQERRAIFEEARSDHIATLERIIAGARARSASCSPCPPSRSMPTGSMSFNTSSTDGISIFRDSHVEDSSQSSCVTMDIGVEEPLVNNNRHELKRPAQTQEGPTTKRLPLGPLDSNVRRLLRSSKGDKRK